MEDLNNIIQVNKFSFLDGMKCTAALMSLVNVGVFAQPSMRYHPILQYLLAMSIADAVYTLSMTLIIPFSSWCGWLQDNNNYKDFDLITCLPTLWHYKLVSEYFTSCLALFNILVEIHITCQRIKLISKEARNNEIEHRPWIACVIIALVSLTVYSPVLFINQARTVEIRNETTGSIQRGYFNEKTDFGNSSEAKLIEQMLLFTRIFLISVVLTVVNSIASIKYTAFYKRKSALKELIRG
jgi:hypothetical protein